MNRQTRKFLWGLIRLVFFLAGLVAWHEAYKRGDHFGWFDWVCIVLVVFAFFDAVDDVRETTEEQ